MILEEYTQSGKWEESLNIFLFVELILNKKEVGSVSIKGHSGFELTDKHIEAYNKCIKEKDYDKIIEWYTKKKSEVEQFKQGFGKEYKKKVVLWSDRVKNKYFKKKLQESQEFEDYLEKFFKKKYGIDLEPFTTPDGQYNKGENKKGIEIKNDMMYKKTGNLYFEYEEKSDGIYVNYVKSGILKDDNSKYFLIGDYDKFWVFRKERLIEIFKEELANQSPSYISKRGIRFVQIATSRGFVFPIKNAEKECIDINTLVKELKKEKKRKYLKWAVFGIIAVSVIILIMYLNKIGK